MGICASCIKSSNASFEMVDQTAIDTEANATVLANVVDHYEHPTPQINQHGTPRAPREHWSPDHQQHAFDAAISAGSSSKDRRFQRR